MDPYKEEKSWQQFEARQYQLELLEYVTNNNAIVYLPTGAGKTYVAIMALKRYSAEMGKTIENGGKRGIFMCRTVELAYQQCCELRRHTSLKIGLYLGGRGVDFWSKERWKKEIEETQVLVGTAQIFLNIISQNFIKVSDLNIVIIDECHHGTKKDAMHEFMRTFKSEPDTSLHPRVIGLTGVLLKGNKLNKVTESLRNLEITFHSKIVTVSSREEFINVLIHSTHPQEKWLLYTPNTASPAVNESINQQIRQCLEIVNAFDIGKQPVKLSKGLIQQQEPNKKKTITRLLSEFQYHLEQYGLYCALFVLQSAILELEIRMRQAETIALRRMYRFTITRFEAMHHMIHGEFREFLKQKDLSTTDYHQLNVILEFSTSKVIQLLKGIEENFAGKDRNQISCLIFVERRQTAKAMCSVIQKFVESTPCLRDILSPDYMVGHNSTLSSTVENILERKWNKKVMSSFRSNIKNMIICSNVLEEGIDIQACNFVIVFDPLKTFNSYIQTKGRARSTDSTFIITASQNDESKVAQQIGTYQEIHETVQKFLIERVLEPTHPNQFEIDREFNDVIPTLKSPSGACLLASSALTALYRYCQMLPWDLFGCVMAQFKKVESNSLGVIVSVRLPLQSRLKEEILSDRMKNVKWAKVSAAMNACRRLYEEGELNESLLPTSRQDCIKSVSHALFKHWEKHESNETNKENRKLKKRLYEKRCPAELYNALPIVGEISYAHKITFVPEFEVNDYNRHVIEALSTKSKFALLLRSRLPRLAPMPLFMRQGSLRAHISSDPLEVVIRSDAELSKLRKHHLMIMRDLLQSWRNFYVQDTRNKQYSFLVVPLSDDDGIDWQTVERFDQLNPIRKPSVEERQSRNYRAEDWLGKIVSRWYANENERLLVTKVHADLNPLAPFPNLQLQCKSYLEYFESRYGSCIERVVDRTQFLIEVKAITARRNFFNNAKDKQKVIQRETQTVLLIPELCHNFEYPGDLWLQAILFPSVLHRLNFLLHAEHLRMRVNSYLGVENPKDYQPKPVMIDVSLRRAVDVDGNACAPPIEKTPTLLPALPVTLTEEVRFKPSEDSINTTTNQFWNTYEEPVYFARKSSNIYPVELQYYCNFDRKWRHNQQLLEVQFTKDQLQRDVATYSTAEPSTTSLTTTPAILQSSLEERRHIEILERGSLETKTTAEQYEFLAALTTSNANDVFDMQRFELLGDSFLKFSISLFVANKFPSWHEGFLTEVKSKLVSNKNLLYCLLDTDIPNRICCNILAMHEWLPPLIGLPENFLELLEAHPEMCSSISLSHLQDIELSREEVLSGRCSEENLKKFTSACTKRSADCNDLGFCTYTDMLGNKIVADTLEALLGVCVKNYGIQLSFRMLEFFGLCRTEPGDEPLTNLLELELGGSQLRAKLNPQEIDAFLINYESLEANLGYTFRDRAYLLQALTHPSFPTNRLTGCYQELEFIGDAILDMLITCYIFERNQPMTPGMLTDLRSALVNNITLGCICVRNRFHLFLLAENILLAEMIKNFDEYQETQGHRVTDQVYILMEEQDAVPEAPDPSIRKFNIAQNVEVPKVLGDIVEALIAAVYLDSRCLHTTWNVIYGLFERELHEFSRSVPIDPVRRLEEHASARPTFCDLTDGDASAIKCIFRCKDKSIAVNGFGANKWQAKKAAAKQALRILDRS